MEERQVWVRGGEGKYDGIRSGELVEAFPKRVIISVINIEVVSEGSDRLT